MVGVSLGLLGSDGAILIDHTLAYLVHHNEKTVIAEPLAILPCIAAGLTFKVTTGAPKSAQPGAPDARPDRPVAGETLVPVIPGHMSVVSSSGSILMASANTRCAGTRLAAAHCAHMSATGGPAASGARS